MNVSHLSQSQVTTYLKCPRQWAYRYGERVRAPRGANLVLGSAFHAAVEHNYRQKMSTGVDLPADTLVDVCATDLDRTLASEEVVLDGATRDSLVDVGTQLVRVHTVALAPKVIPVEVEKKFAFDLWGQGFDFVGYWDVVDDHAVIIDNKSWSKPSPQEDVDRDIQLTAYSVGYRVTKGRPEAGLRFDAVLKPTSRFGARALRRTTSRTDDEAAWFLDLVSRVAKAIASEAFPQNPTGWWCSKRFCSYYSLCRPWSNTVMLDLGAKGSAGLAAGGSLPAEILAASPADSPRLSQQPTESDPVTTPE